jgi:hypothetical protein
MRDSRFSCALNNATGLTGSTSKEEIQDLHIEPDMNICSYFIYSGLPSNTTVGRRVR